MKKQLQIKKGEPLYKWVNRIAEHYNLSQEMKDVLSEVSKESYIHGSVDAQEILLKHK